MLTLLLFMIDKNCGVEGMNFFQLLDGLVSLLSSTSSSRRLFSMKKLQAFQKYDLDINF